MESSVRTVFLGAHTPLSYNLSQVNAIVKALEAGRMKNAKCKGQNAK